MLASIDCNEYEPYTTYIINQMCSIHYWLMHIEGQIYHHLIEWFVLFASISTFSVIIFNLPSSDFSDNLHIKQKTNSRLKELQHEFI